MPLDLSALVEPVSPELPCGEDLDADGSLAALLTLAAGKPETQWSAAVEADWNEVLREAERMLRRGKHLRVALLATHALLRTEGLSGLVTGLALIEGLLSRYWDVLPPVPASLPDPGRLRHPPAARARPRGPGPCRGRVT